MPPGLGLYEGVIIEYAPEQIRRLWMSGGMSSLAKSEGSVPGGVNPTGGVRQEVYSEYRLGRQSACADLVIATRLADGTGAVLLSLRNNNVCFPGTWWIYGGATPVYQDIVEFVASRAKGECGVPVRPQVLLGMYITSSAGTGPEHIGSTMNACYAAQVPLDLIEQHRHTDEGHQSVKLFTLEEYLQLPAQQRHWYVEHVVRRTLENMP